MVYEYSKMASTTMIETVTITRPLKTYYVNSDKCEKPSIGLASEFALVKIHAVMQTHGNLTVSYLWQPGEFARRMLGDRPSPIPPTRELWPASHQPLSISTLHVAYLQDDPLPRRAATLPPQLYTEPAECVHNYGSSSVCTVGTNTDPPPTVLTSLKALFQRKHVVPPNYASTGPLTAVPRETTFDVKVEDNPAQRAWKGIKKAITGAKYKIAPRTDTVDSPKIVYDMSKPGDRMTSTFGAREGHRWMKLPSRTACSRRLRAIGGWCRQRPRRPPRRQPHPPRLQITQV